MSGRPAADEAARDAARDRVHFGDNLAALRELPDGMADLVYADPPFNTGSERRLTRQRALRDEDGERVGFGDRRYRVEAGTSRAFADDFDDYLAWLEPRLVETRRVMAPHATFYLHLDYREVHYAKVMLDGLFGRSCFLNEIIWAYDYGARARRRWPPKHDTILVYVRDPKRYHFDAEAVERIPYMAPNLVGTAKAARGKLPTDTWWHTIVPTAGSERTGYPTQKPLGILRRIVAASSRTGDMVLDWCAGSGTTGVAARELGRRFTLFDDNPEAIEVMAARLGREGIDWTGSGDGASGAEASPRDAASGGDGEATASGNASVSSTPSDRTGPQPSPPEAGLCEGCVHVRLVRSARGPVYVLCRAAAADATLSKYPRLPVLSCHAFRARDGD